MNTEAQNTSEQQASANADASFQMLLSSWKAVFESIKLKVHSHSDLVAADFQLSVKAIVLAAICILVFVGLALVLWATLLITMTFGLISVGIHWAICATVVVLLNLFALFMIKRLLSDAIQSISMQATAEALLASEEA